LNCAEEHVKVMGIVGGSWRVLSSSNREVCVCLPVECMQLYVCLRVSVMIYRCGLLYAHTHGHSAAEIEPSCKGGFRPKVGVRLSSSSWFQFCWHCCSCSCCSCCLCVCPFER